MPNSEISFYEKNTEMLKQWREILWDSGAKRSAVFMLPYLKGIYGMKSNLDEIREYVSPEIYESFIKEYNMTIYLLYKCLIKLRNKYSFSINESDNLEIDSIISQVSNYIENSMDVNSTLLALREEDQSTQKVLKEIGLPEDKIEEIILAGHRLDSVLDTEPSSKLKK